MNIIIPLGGIGERFKKSKYSEFKPLIKILDKEMIFYVLDNLNLHEEDNIFIIYNNLLDKHNFCQTIKNYIKKNIYLVKLENKHWELQKHYILEQNI